VGASPDQSYLIFTSAGHQETEAHFRFYISYRRPDGSWTTPQRLNGELAELEASLCPAITPDGRFMFFIGEGDIWWVSADFIEEMHPDDLDE
jgi:hypothetical protein